MFHHLNIKENQENKQIYMYIVLKLLCLLIIKIII